jgi:hypothetical protein
MKRALVIAAILALTVPSIALAAPPPKGKGGPPKGKVFVKPAFVPKGGPVAHGKPFVHGGPVVHVVVAPWVFHGHSYAWHPVHFPHPWVYPPGFAYRLWVVGAILPPIFWSTPTYYYTGWADMGLPPPDPGFQYVEYGPDLLLVNVATGEVVQVFPGAFS